MGSESSALVVQQASKVLSLETVKRGKRPYDNTLITEQLNRVEQLVSRDHANELIRLYRLQDPNVDGTSWPLR
jgi:hypothetical protein